MVNIGRELCIPSIWSAFETPPYRTLAVLKHTFFVREQLKDGSGIQWHKFGFEVLCNRRIVGRGMFTEVALLPD